MRLIASLLLCLFFPFGAVAQTAPPLRPKGNAEFGVSQGDAVVAYKFLGAENKLLMIGGKVIQSLDVASVKWSEPISISVPDFTEDKERVISPDGRLMLISGNYGSTAKKDRVKQPASVWSLRTGKVVAFLDRAKPVRAGFWSKNGKTLVTSSDRFAPITHDDAAAEIAFWDGATLRYRNSLPAEKINWWRLSDDGGTCLYTSGTVKNLLVVKELSFTGGPINFWDVDGARIERVIEQAERRTRSISVSSDEKYLAYVAQKPKTKDAERRLVVWEIGKDDQTSRTGPLYELAPNPKIPYYGIEFSNDGKFFGMEVGKNLQIYETATGAKRFEFPTIDYYPTHWLRDNNILLYGHGLVAYEVTAGRELYRHEMIYEISEYTNSDGNTFSSVLDRTTTVVHPDRDLFLTHSNQYVKVFDSNTGVLVQTLVSPPMDYSKKKPKLSDKPLVRAAGWSDDGKTLYVIGSDGKTISLWDFVGG